jgi:hypothetical protein
MKTKEITEERYRNGSDEEDIENTTVPNSGGQLCDFFIHGFSPF